MEDRTEPDELFISMKHEAGGNIEEPLHETLTPNFIENSLNEEDQLKEQEQTKILLRQKDIL